MVWQKSEEGSFPGSSVVKNQPANAGDPGSIPDQEDPTYQRATKSRHCNYWACALERESRNYWSLHALESVLGNKRRYCNEKPAHGNQRVAPALHN